jgi:hypothetical protein
MSKITEKIALVFEIPYEWKHIMFIILCNSMLQNHSALGPLPYPFLWGKAIPPNNCKSVSHIDFRHL